MKLLISTDEFLKLKSRDNVPIECNYCKNTFYGKKHLVAASLKNSISAKRNYDYCSLKCAGLIKNVSVKCNCKQCNIELQRTPSTLKKIKNIFCSKSCAAKYNNTHKSQGTRRSKLETWIEQKLLDKYPKLKFEFNKTNAINSELDIYIPSLKLAFELNGLFHYEPIYGDKKLNEIKNNDNRKFQACLENNIELCIIDTSKQKYFKEQSSYQYLDIITNIIDKNGHDGRI